MRRRTLLRIAKHLQRNRPGLPHLPHPLPIEMARVAQWFHAASDTTRLAILEFLSQRERCVNELEQVLDAPQSTISFHLKVLRQSGLVGERREGRSKYYRLRGQTLDFMIPSLHTATPANHAPPSPRSSSPS